jgi:hypothetical protein
VPRQREHRALTASLDLSAGVGPPPRELDGRQAAVDTPHAGARDHERQRAGHGEHRDAQRAAGTLREHRCAGGCRRDRPQQVQRQGAVSLPERRADRCVGDGVEHVPDARHR